MCQEFVPEDIERTEGSQQRAEDSVNTIYLIQDRESRESMASADTRKAVHDFAPLPVY